MCVYFCVSFVNQKYIWFFLSPEFKPIGATVQYAVHVATCNNQPCRRSLTMFLFFYIFIWDLSPWKCNKMSNKTIVWSSPVLNRIIGPFPNKEAAWVWSPSPVFLKMEITNRKMGDSWLLGFREAWEHGIMIPNKSIFVVYLVKVKPLTWNEP